MDTEEQNRIPTFVIDWQETLLKTDLPANAKYIGMYLRTFMNAKSDIAWPSLKRIEQETGLGHATVLKYLRVLEDSGWLSRERGSKGVNTRYHACLPSGIEEIQGRSRADLGRSRADLGRSRADLYRSRADLGVGREPTTNNQVNNQVITNKDNQTTSDSENSPSCSRIPVQKIVDLYHERLPELPNIEKLTEARRASIKQRWREDLKTLDDWGRFFDAVRKSDFLMGRTEKPFQPNLEWLTKAGNFAKIIEGKYHGQHRQPVEQPKLGPTERTRRAREAARAKQASSGGWSAPGASDMGRLGSD